METSENKRCEKCNRECNARDLHSLKIGGFIEFPRQWVCRNCQEKMDDIIREISAIREIFDGK